MLEVMQHLEIQASGALSQQASNRRILPNAVKHQISAQTSSALGPVGVSKPLPKKRVGRCGLISYILLTQR